MGQNKEIKQNWTAPRNLDICFCHYAKNKCFIKEFFSKCYLTRSFLRICSHLLKKSLMENFIFCAVCAHFSCYWLPIYHSFISSLCSPEYLSLEEKYVIFRYGDEGSWQKHPAEYSLHKIVDLFPSSMFQISGRRKKPSRWKNINTHTHTPADINNWQVSYKTAF